MEAFGGVLAIREFSLAKLEVGIDLKVIGSRADRKGQTNSRLG